ncbi:MAG: RNA polymerase sigma factor RpoD/SigA [Spirochaetaceae bacterium]|jgi:RNA polymerase primary sigma factor|nr:RNA polymerase sigma factor RpoD/SigA [Spirochaetaceae bacterium]
MTATKRKTGTKNDKNTLAMYLREINNIPLLTRDEEEKCAREAVAGNLAAQHKLVSANLRFVVNVAKKYQGQGIPLEDLIGEGNLGLLNAIKRYNVDKGYHFISYAVWWIRQAILKAICEKSRMIRLPLNRANELVQIEKARRLVQEGESELKEVARLLDMDVGHVEDLLMISRDMVSLENPIYNEKDSSTMGDFIEAVHYQTPEAHAMDAVMHDDIELVLGNLDKKEADVIRFRYGLGNRPPLSLKEIGDHFNLTKERIRQIEKKALIRLQRTASRRVLETYVA